MLFDSFVMIFLSYPWCLMVGAEIEIAVNTLYLVPFNFSYVKRSFTIDTLHISHVLPYIPLQSLAILLTGILAVIIM
jgi:hypothetical protein